jgi:2-polyprenyl-3-methyl-5-hydroxy-6-metoxy-1,4-benzoquinol methylase
LIQHGAKLAATLNDPGHTIDSAFLERLELAGSVPRQVPGYLDFGHTQIPVRDDIPRFTPDSEHAANFGLLRQKHSRLQLDSVNGTTDRRDTLLRRTGWPPEFWRGKVVLECGCGAGPDTEILLALGARVLSVDLAGVDVARANVGKSPSVQFVQASIASLPLREKSFDVVFCHRVLQHTADPRSTLAHILRFVKPDGAVFIHSYSRSMRQRMRWKYALLPLTNKLPPETLYRIIRAYARPAFRLTNFTGRSRIGRRLNWIFVPFLNYRHASKFRGMPDENLLEYAIHDTFDALSPRYDKPLSVAVMRSVAATLLERPFEVVDDGTVTLLRSVLR